MAQFPVYRNKNAQTRGAIPCVVDIQSGILDHLDPRVVIPLAKAKSIGGPPSETLKLEFEIDGERLILLTPLLAGVSKKILGAEVGSLASHSFEIVAALDLIVSGV